MTVIYFVRHAHSDYSPDEYNRPLSMRGFQDVERINTIFESIEVTKIISSPYKRAIQTVEGIAQLKTMEVVIIDELKERTLSEVPVDNFEEAIQKIWQDEQFAFEGGESNVTAQKRAINALLPLLQPNSKIVIGTHGNIMTLILNYFDCSIGFEFWQALKMPDVIECTIDNQQIKELKSLY